MKGPFVLKYDRKYYLMYSANYYASRDYAVGYAVSENPKGPFLKAAHNPVLFAGNSQLSGRRRSSVTMSPNGKELFIVYHVHTDAHGRSRNPSGD